VSAASEEVAGSACKADQESRMHPVRSSSADSTPRIKKGWNPDCLRPTMSGWRIVVRVKFGSVLYAIAIAADNFGAKFPSLVYFGHPVQTAHQESRKVGTLIVASHHVGMADCSASEIRKRTLRICHRGRQFWREISFLGSCYTSRGHARVLPRSTPSDPDAVEVQPFNS